MGSKAKTISSPEPTQPLRSMETHHGAGWRVHPSHHQGSGLSSAQDPQDQGLSLQTPPVEELPGRNLNQDTSPARVWTPLEEESAPSFTIPARCSPGRAASPADALSLPLTPSAHSPARVANIRLFAGE